MTQLWRNEQDFVVWTSAVMGVVVFSLLIQTYLQPYGLAILIGVLVFYLWRKKALEIGVQQSFWLLLGSSIFIVGLIGNLFTTENLPVTLHESLKWLVGLAVFLSAVLLAPKKNYYRLYWLSLLVVFGVLGFLSLLTWIVPALQLLPEMNFLYATFGHNHFSAVLLFMVPWLVLGHTVFPSPLWKWALAIWVFWLFSTFSRLGVVVGMLELGVLAIWLKSDRVWRQLLVRWLLVVLTFGLLWWGLQVLGKNQTICARNTYVTQRICKASLPEQRPEYWRQAFESMQQHTVWGGGLGTFSSSSLRYRKAPGSYAAHVHNDYFEWTVEAGWWGVFVTVILWGIWLRSFPRTENWFMRAVWLSTGSLLTLGLFDFDLQFVVFLFAVLTGLGWLLSMQCQDLKKHRFSRFFIFWLKSVVFVAAVVVIAWAALFLALNLDWQYGNKQLLAKYSQYYPAHSFLLIKIWPQLSPEKRAELQQLWWQDYRVLDFLLEQQTAMFTTEQVHQLLSHVYNINPWSRQKYDLAALQLKTNDLAAARQTLQNTTVFANTIEARFNVSFRSEGDDLRWRQARQYRELAEKMIAENNGLQAVEDMHQAAQFEPWILDDQTKQYCEGLKNWVQQQPNSDLDWQQKWSDQLRLFDAINPTYFGNCKTELALIALEQLTVQLRHNRCFDGACNVWSQRALRWSQNEVWVQEFLAGRRAQFPTQQF